MVRNARVVMMCGLLAAATGLALSGGAIPVVRRGPSASDVLAMLVPGLGLWSSRALLDAPAVAAPALHASSPDTDVTPRDVDDAPTLEGAREPRQPRGPREGRDAIER